MKIFKSVQEVYLESLHDLKEKGKLVNSITDPSSIGSYFGKKDRDFVEILGYSFVLSNPRNRLIYSKARNLSFGFNVANLIWLLSGKNEVDVISFYNNRGNAYSKNGIYYEAAFGDRIFGNHKLWNAAKELLIKDQNTRRALMPIFIPNDLKTLPNDTPCASSIQVMIRDKEIDFFLHMRSQSVAMVFPYDIFLFTMLHEFISKIFNLPMGKFYYYCNSFHYYLEESVLVERILSEEQSHPLEMNEMCTTDDKMLKAIIIKEEEIRKSVKEGIEISDTDFEDIPDYWKNLFHVLYSKACTEHNVIPKNFQTKYLLDKELFL